MTTVQARLIWKTHEILIGDLWVVVIKKIDTDTHCLANVCLAAGELIADTKSPAR